MDEKLFMAFLSKTLNLDKKQVAELVKTEDGETKEDALDILLGKHADHIKTVKVDKADTKEFFNNGYAKAKQEVLGTFESDVMKHFGIDTKKQGLELVEAIVAEKTKALETQELTPDQVKKSETYLSMVNAMKQEKEEEVGKVTTDFTKQIQGYQQAEKFKTVTSKADEIINKLNPVFSTNPAVAQNQRNAIYNQLKSKQFEINDGGRIVPLNKDGKALENEHGHPIGFESVVTDVTKGLFDLKESSDRNSVGDLGDDEGDTNKWTGTAPKNDEEYLKMIEKATSLEDKKAITKAYEESQA